MSAPGRSPIADRLVYVAARAGMWLVRALPWPAARWLGRRLGDLGYTVDRPKRRRHGVRNLTAAYPGMTPRDARRLLRRSYRHFGEVLAAGLHMLRGAGGDLTRGIVAIEGRNLLEGLDFTRGVVCVSGHVGNWEVLGAAMALAGLPGGLIVRGLDNPLLDAYVARLRAKTGVRLIPKVGALRVALRMLREGQSVGFLIDQDAREEGVFVDFFGRPASTTPGPAVMAMRTGCPVVFAYARAIPGTRQFRVRITDVVRPEEFGEGDEGVRTLTQRLSDDLERAVREDPEQWIWRHKRWRTRAHEGTKQ